MEGRCFAYFLRVKIGKNQKNQSRLLNCPISASTAIAGMLGFYKEIEYKFTNKQKFPQGKHIYTWLLIDAWNLPLK